MNIYVGNLPYKIEEDALRQAFEDYGAVSKVTILKDKFTGQSRGFGFVEMTSDEDATRAIEGLNGAEMQGRTLKVNEARPRPERDDRGGGRRGGYDRRGRE